MKAYIYDSFTEEKFKGNQAAIILEADDLDEYTMQNIAKEFNYSETAFLFKSSKALKKVKFFTPNSEVDLCGHATIALVKCLYDNGELINIKEGENTIEIETNLGIIPIILNIKENKLTNILMYQDEGKIDSNLEISYKEILDSLGLENKKLGDLKIVKSYTGLWDILIHLNKKEDLYNITPNINKIKEISKKTNTISLHTFVLEKGKNENLIAYVRNFAPIVDINEESATGTSNAALAYFLYSKKILNDNSLLTSIQGKNMGRESSIISQVVNNKVLVGGNAIKIFEGEIFI